MVFLPRYGWHKGGRGVHPGTLATCGCRATFCRPRTTGSSRCSPGRRHSAGRCWPRCSGRPPCSSCSNSGATTRPWGSGSLTVSSRRTGPRTAWCRRSGSPSACGCRRPSTGLVTDRLPSYPSTSRGGWESHGRSGEWEEVRVKSVVRAQTPVCSPLGELSETPLEPSVSNPSELWPVLTNVLDGVLPSAPSHYKS